MMTPADPSATRLINIPVLFNNRKSFLLLYTNDLKVGENRIPDLPDTQLPLMGAPVNYSNNSTDQLMIVPIPNPNNDTDFGLVSVSEYSVKDFRHSVHEIGKSLMDEFEQPKMRSRSMMLGMDNYSFSNSLSVVRVGNYDISIAPTYQDLLQNVNWDHFNLPSDFETRKATLTNRELYPINMAYVVAKAVKNIKDDGFGVIYRSANQVYFPTAHEATRSVHDYDVICYDFADKSQDYPFQIKNRYSYSDSKYLIPVSGSGTALTLTENDIGVIRTTLRKLSTKCLTNNGNDATFQIDHSRIKVLNVIPIKTRADNQNMWLQKTTSLTTPKDQSLKEQSLKERTVINNNNTNDEYEKNEKSTETDAQIINMCNII
jgi:hypothetical protein